MTYITQHSLTKPLKTLSENTRINTSGIRNVSVQDLIVKTRKFTRAKRKRRKERQGQHNGKTQSPFDYRYIPTWLGLFFIRLICFLPYSLAIQFGRVVIFIVNHLVTERKQIAKTNIELCYPNKTKEEQQQLLENTIAANGIGAMEGLYSWWANDKQVLSRTEVKGLELIDQAKAEGRGVILLGMHFTTLDFCGRALAQTIALDTMYKTQSNRAIDHCLKKARLKYYGNVLERYEMRRFIKNLKQKHVIWYACDQDFGRKNSVFAPLFGVEAATLATLGRLIKITKAKPLMCKHFRHSDDGLGKSRYVIEIYDPFTEESLSEDDQRNAILINQAVEQAINDKPEQYFWVHRRFKRRPNGSDPKIYKD
jgi:KDO2-lipid IV(A) lauroyltransferase